MADPQSIQGTRLTEKPADGLHISLQRAPCEVEAIEYALCSQLVSGSARVGDNDRDVTEIRRVSHCGLNAHFECDANNHECGDAAVAQRDVERRAFER